MSKSKEEWFKEKLHEAEKELKSWQRIATKEKQSRQIYEEQLLDARREIISLKHINKGLQSQVAEFDLLSAKLKETISENQKLSRQLNKRNGLEEPYGLGTPSSKQVNKKNSTEENRKKKGGAVENHKGSGRKVFTKAEADVIINLNDKTKMCDCGGKWHFHSIQSHCTYKYIPAKLEKVYYEKSVFQCSGCNKISRSSAPGVLPGYLYSNSVIANMLVEHYLYGHTAGELERRWGINIGTFFNFAHRTANYLSPLFNSIVEKIRYGLIIFADETPWSNNGAKGYAWFFGNDDYRIFVFRHTRSSSVPLSILGTYPLPGVLITDRYAGYVSALDIARQYCLVHILRDVKKEEKNFPNDEEVVRFARDIKPLLSEAISLRNKNKQRDNYLKKALKIKNKIMDICMQEAQHPAVQYIQNIFRENTEKLFQWVRSPDIPADNNYAERELRPIVISRKISFGSQSERGLNTREILMTIIQTAKCRGHDPALVIEELLNARALDPDVDIVNCFDKIEKQANIRGRVA